MRSMHIIGSREEASAERFFQRLTRSLAGRGEQVLAVLRPDCEFSGRIGPGVVRETVRMRSIYDPFARARIGALAKGFAAQVVQTYMGRATRLTRIKAHSAAPVHVARMGRYHDLKGFRHAHAWVATTAGIRSYLIDAGLPAERVYHVRSMVEPPAPRDPAALSALRQRLDLEENARVILCVARLHLNSGIDLLLEALARLPPRGADDRLRTVIVGDGPRREPLAEQARRLGIDDAVRLLAAPAEPDAYLGLADLFVYPSRDAPTGTAVMEAWNRSVPVVAAAAPGPRELIRDGRNGILVPVDDADALAAGITRALDAGDAERAAMVAAAREQVTRDHGVQAVTDAYLQIYAKLLA